MAPPGTPFRILSLDGGGIKGAFSAAILAELERMSGKRIVDHFDMIAGTSTGGIIALGLGTGLPAQEILDFYRDDGERIFSARHSRGWWRAAYDGDSLKEALERVFGERVLGEACCLLVIPAFDADAGQVHVFKTPHAPRLKQDHRCRVVEVALATAAAPTYFPIAVSREGKALCDGGVWAACPAAIAVLEAVCVLGIPREQIKLLSIGTTSEPVHISRGLFRAGRLPWMRKGRIIELLMAAQVIAALSQARLLLGDGLMRLDQTSSPGRFGIDDFTQLRELVSIGLQVARHEEQRVGAAFLEAPAPPFRSEMAVARRFVTST